MADWHYKKYLRLGLFLFLSLLAIYFVFLVRRLFLSFLLATALTYLLQPVVAAVERRGASRVMAISLVYVALGILIGGIFLYAMPSLIEQLNLLIDEIPEYTRKVQLLSRSLQYSYARAGLPEAVRMLIEERILMIERDLQELAQRVLSGIVAAVGYFLSIFFAPILAFYMLKDIETFTEKIVLLIPEKWRADVLRLGREINQVVSSFFRGYLLVSLIVGTITGFTLSILGVDFAFILGIFAGLTNIIPYFGPIIGAVPAVAVALLESEWLAVKVVLAFIVIQQIEASIISPRVLGNRVGLHPLFVILVILAGGELYGLTGVILAVPVAAVLRVVFVYLFTRFARTV